MTLYGRFRRLKIDFSWIGLQKGSEQGDYYCTPVGAKVIGWAGTDGIHYCFIKGFEDMVFMVDPTNYGGKLVQPLARSFEDFLRLLLACGDPVTLENAYASTQERFDAWMQENPLPAEQTAVLDKIRKVFSLTPMEHPFAYVKELQTSFDYGKIRYSAEYYESFPEEQQPPAWKVYFSSGFYPPESRKRPGEEIPVGKELAWGGESWYIPAVYACSEGLVMDLCRKIEPERVRSFYETYDPEEMDSMSWERREQCAAENPMNFDFTGTALLNGKRLSVGRIQSIYWVPEDCRAEGSRAEFPARWVLEHYGLDAGFCWAFHRVSLSWATKRKPVIKSLALTLEQRPVSIPGPHFSLLSGESIAFTHPVTGLEHTLTVQESEQKEMERNFSFREDLEFPPYFTVMTYTLDPDIPGMRFSVQDCANGDPARKKSTREAVHSAAVAPVIGRIGGADGPTVIFTSALTEEPKLYAACSATHFEPVEKTQWRIVFHEKMLEDIEIQLL